MLLDGHVRRVHKTAIREPFSALAPLDRRRWDHNHDRLAMLIGLTIPPAEQTGQIFSVEVASGC
jgi:hypothetical protein